MCKIFIKSTSMTKNIVISIVILLMLNISCRKKEIKENSIYFYNNTSDTLLYKMYYNGSNVGLPKGVGINPFSSSCIYMDGDYDKSPTLLFRNYDSVFISKNSDTSIWIKFFSNKEPFNYNINPSTNDSAWIFKGTSKGARKSNFSTQPILSYNYWFEIK